MYYRTQGEHTAWASRQALVKQQLLCAASDFICLQECTGSSFDSDFAFLREAGYSGTLGEKGGLMRVATFCRADVWEVVSTQNKFRTLVQAFRQLQTGRIVYIVNVHLPAGPQQPNRRLQAVHDALQAVSKDAKKLGLDEAAAPVVFCGDFNSAGNTGARELLTKREVGPDFREAGADKPLTSKGKRTTLGCFADAAEAAFGGRPPATLLVANIDSKMADASGEMTQGLKDALTAAFKRRGADGAETFEDFMADKVECLNEGKFWALEYVLTSMGAPGMAIPHEGPCELRFDYIFYTVGALRLCGVQQPLTEAQHASTWGEPWDVLPCSWHPSDHLPVAAAFAFPSDASSCDGLHCAVCDGTRKLLSDPCPLCVD